MKEVPHKMLMCLALAKLLFAERKNRGSVYFFKLSPLMQKLQFPTY